ncbi:MAG: hypothetical protein FWG87_06695 [Defluviitaleaceae bacterium]|nr:hypothetical protein [Defluviitaleaceae bacterium]
MLIVTYKGMEREFSWICRIYADLKVIRRRFNGFTQIYTDFPKSQSAKSAQIRVLFFTNTPLHFSQRAFIYCVLSLLLFMTIFDGYSLRIH